MSVPETLEEMVGIPRHYNPIIRFAIRPALRLVNARDHPIRGGISAAVASGAAHYLLVEGLRYASDFIYSPSTFPTEAHQFLGDIPLPVHILFGVNMAVNLGIGIYKAVIGKDAWEVEKKNYFKNS